MIETTVPEADVDTNLVAVVIAGGEVHTDPEVVAEMKTEFQRVVKKCLLET